MKRPEKFYNDVKGTPHTDSHCPECLSESIDVGEDDILMLNGAICIHGTCGNCGLKGTSVYKMEYYFHR